MLLNPPGKTHVIDRLSFFCWLVRGGEVGIGVKKKTNRERARERETGVREANSNFLPSF